ncbi:MAG: hypothetical protein K5839_04790 [Treponemataceae bacterium]|nr:hypothetical protein [Treponemataceae bacterium]
MKKRIFILCMLIAFFSLSCCAKNNKDSKKIDLDFAGMNYNMAAARLFNVLIESDNYLGQSVRFQGQYFVSYRSDYAKPLHACIMFDAAACCQIGFDFMVPDDVKLPLERTEIEIEGIFSHTLINGMDYFYVDCKDIKILD